MTNTSKLYSGIAHSDALIHNYINPILNLFTPTPNSGTVKIMSNATCTSKFGDTSSEYVNQLKRNLHGHANIRVQTCKEALYNDSNKQYLKWSIPEYYYVTSSVYMTEDGMCLSIARDFAEKISAGNNKYIHNKFLLIDKDEMFHIIEYTSVAADFVKNRQNKKCNKVSPDGNRNYLYKVVEPAIAMNKDPHVNAHYFKDVHIGVTRYATHIKGTPCKIAFYDNDGEITQIQTFKSTKEAFDKLSSAFDVNISYKTFIRLVTKNSLKKFILKGSVKEILIGLCLVDEEPLTPEVTETTTIPEFETVVTTMKALDVVVAESDIYLAKQCKLSAEEFIEYLLKKEQEADRLYNEEYKMPESSEEFTNEEVNVNMSNFIEEDDAYES